MTVPERPDLPEEVPPVVRDKRRIDPTTGELREQATPEMPVPPTPEGARHTASDTSDLPDLDAEASPDAVLAEQRLSDLLRERAEFVNYRNRVTREREQDTARATGQVVEGLLPVLDDLYAARAHGELVGPMAAVATKLEEALARFGVEQIAETGVTFDPTVHDAMMHDPSAEVPEGVETPVVTAVMQPGYRIGERLVRPARVVVSGQ